MRLEETLLALLHQIPGALFAVLADAEGEAVVTASLNGESEYEIKVVGAHQGILLSRAGEMSVRTGWGEARQLIFFHDRFQIITASISRGYYLVLTLDPKKHGLISSRARTALNTTLGELKKEIG